MTNEQGQGTSNHGLEAPSPLAPRHSPLFLHLVALLLVTILLNLPMLSSRVVFVHDTLNSLIYFDFAYSELLHHHDFPRWIPVLGYGVPYDLHLFATVQPADGVVMLAGLTFGVSDTLLLYKLSMILSQGVFVLGLFLLSRRLYSSMVVTWMVCLGAVLTNSWMHSIIMNFTIFYLLPLVLFLLIRFFDTGYPRYLWSAALFETLSLYGTLPYIAPVHLLILGTFVLPCFWNQPRALRYLVNWRTYVHPLFFLFVLFAGMTALLVLGLEAALLSPDREGAEGMVRFKTFLEYARQPLAGMITALVKGDVYQGEMTLFLGVLPLTGVVYALFRRRDTYFVAFLLVALFLFWFSAGEWLGALAHRFVPLMNRFRHVSHVFNILRIFLLILGGLGLDRFLADFGEAARASNAAHYPAPYGARLAGAWQGLGFWIFVLLAFYMVVDFSFTRKEDDLTQFWLHSQAESYWTSTDRVAQGWYVGRFMLHAGLFAALLWLLLRKASTLATVRWLLATVFFLDVGFYYVNVMRQAPYCPADVPVAQEFQARPWEYSLRRRPDDDLADVEARIARLNTPRGGIHKKFASVYSSVYLLLRVDPVRPAYRLDMVMPCVKEMIEARGGSVKADSAMVLPANDEPFLRSLGKGLDKIRVVGAVKVAEDDTAAKRMFSSSQTPDPSATLVIVKKDGGEVYGPLAAVSPASTVRVFPSSVNRVVVKVQADEPGWLYCADAYHPAWKATVKGQPAEVVRANVGFRAVHVDKGASDVVFYLDGGWRDVLRGGVLGFVVIGGFCLVGSLIAVPIWLWRRPLPEKEVLGLNSEGSTNSPLCAGIWLGSMMLVMLGFAFLCYRAGVP